MCRLSGFTARDLDPAMKRLFWHQLMLVSNAEGQFDGTGMTDGELLLKCELPFSNFGADWVSQLRHDAIWVGHVRSASPNTAHTVLEAHPFVFDVGDTRLFAAHNGGIKGMPAASVGEPKVDSYQAFKLLIALLQEQRDFTPELINTWVSKFGVGSEWAFMFHYQDKLTIVRGVRPMCYMEFNDGIMFNTSYNVLLHMKEWVRLYWGKNYRIGKITEIADYQMTTLAIGSHAIELSALSKPVALPVFTGLYYKYDGKEHLIKRA